METLDRLKLSLRLDTDEDDELLKLYLESAKGYIKGAIGIDEDFYTQNQVVTMLDTAIIAQATGYYTARTSLTNIPMNPVNMTVNSIINQLRGKYALYLETKDVDDEN